MNAHYIPRISGDAFRNRIAVEIVAPGELGCNDHCLFEDAEGRWHCIGIINHPKSGGEQFFHAVGETPIRPMEVLKPIYEIRQGERTCWAPCTVSEGSTIHFFWTDATEFAGLSDDLFDSGKTARNTVSSSEETTQYGGWQVYCQRHATAPMSEVTRWTHHGAIFREEGAVRDPHVVRVDGRWMMIYCRRVDPGTQYGESVVSYRFSDDLFSWGDRAGDLVRGIEDTQWLGSSESPFLLRRDEGWYLFVSHVGPSSYHRTKVWFSEDPTSFGKDKDAIAVLFSHAAEVFEYKGRTWITNTGCHSEYYGVDFPDNIGVEVAELEWDPAR